MGSSLDPFSGLAGALGGSLYLLSIDGFERFRAALHRRTGWLAMLVAMMLPSSLSFFLLPMVVTLVPTLIRVASKGDAVTSP
ncbi:MAG TPA: hypothetical protein VE569_04190 [Acidimicrobiia bacterium]|nr:hypothetical protein [Acidimicrobiia bacterium]